MAICDLCDNEMTTGAGCSISVLHRDGRAWELTPHVGRGSSQPCGDCGVLRGGLHHLGCDRQDCPSCGRPLITCSCEWDEMPDDDDDEPDPELWPDEVLRKAGLTPFAAAVAPLRARHHDRLREIAGWALAAGRPCNLDGVALVVDVLDRRRDAGAALDRPDVNELITCDLRNALSQCGTIEPIDLLEQVWTTLTFLADHGDLPPGTPPLQVLLEPLRCYGGLDADGRHRPFGPDVDFPCQCHIPYDRTCPPNRADRIVGRDPDTYEPFLARGTFLPRSANPAMSWFAPLAALSRRLREDEVPIDLHIDEFTFQGQVLPRNHAPILWVYTFVHSGEDVVVDGDGYPHRPRPDRRRKLGYRWEPISDSAAIHRCGFFDAASVRRRAEGPLALLR